MRLLDIETSVVIGDFEQRKQIRSRKTVKQGESAEARRKERQEKASKQRDKKRKAEVEYNFEERI